MGEILFTEQAVKSNFIAAANRNKFVADFYRAVFNIVDFVDGNNIRFVNPDKFLRVE